VVEVIRALEDMEVVVAVGAMVDMEGLVDEVKVVVD
jgi:hypothetical protein